MDDYKKIISLLRNFTKDRDWDQFHDSRNLSLALFLEAAELNELFLWMKDSDVESVNKDKLKEELADVLNYAFMLADKHNLNVFEIMEEKINKNAKKYPVDKAKGNSKKYSEL